MAFWYSQVAVSVRMFVPVGCVLKATARNRIDYEWLRVVRGNRKFSNRKLYRVKSLLCSGCFVYDITEKFRCTYRKYRIYELWIHHAQYEKKYSKLYMRVKLHTRTHIWQMCNFYANINNRHNRLCWLKSRPYTTRTWKYTVCSLYVFDVAYSRLLTGKFYLKHFASDKDNWNETIMQRTIISDNTKALQQTRFDMRRIFIGARVTISIVP